VEKFEPPMNADKRRLKTKAYRRSSVFIGGSMDFFSGAVF